MTRSDAITAAAAHQLVLCAIKNLLEAGVPSDPTLGLSPSQIRAVTRVLENLALGHKLKIDAVASDVAASTQANVLDMIEYLICGTVND